MDPSTASEVIPPLNPEDDPSPGEPPIPADEEKLAVPPAVVLEEEVPKAPETPNQPQPEPPTTTTPQPPTTPAGSSSDPQPTPAGGNGVIADLVGTEDETLLGTGLGMGVDTTGSVPVKHDNNVVRFKDIQGYGKAKKDLAGVVDLLKDPKGTDLNAKKLGGKTPKGVVIFGTR